MSQNTSALKRKTIHFILQSKGGAGKTVLAVNMTQFLESRGHKVVCISNDTAHSGLMLFKSLKPTDMKISNEFDEIQREKFRDIFISAKQTDADDFIVDNGGTASLEFLHWISNRGKGLFNLLSGLGLDVKIHTVIEGGGGYEACLNYLKDLLSTLPADMRVFVWLNPFNGRVIEVNDRGEDVSFEKTPFFLERKSRLKCIGLPEFMMDVKKPLIAMYKAGERFEEAGLKDPFGLGFDHLAIMEAVPDIYYSMSHILDEEPGSPEAGNAKHH